MLLKHIIYLISGAKLVVLRNIGKKSAFFFSPKTISAQSQIPVEPIPLELIHCPQIRTYIVISKQEQNPL